MGRCFRKAEDPGVNARDLPVPIADPTVN